MSSFEKLYLVRIRFSISYAILPKTSFSIRNTAGLPVVFIFEINSNVSGSAKDVSWSVSI